MDELGAEDFLLAAVPVTINAGSMALSNGGVLPLSGIINNSGVVALESTGAATALELIQYGVTLQGGGALTLSDSDANVIVGTVGSVTLTNVDNTIPGAGELDAGQMTLGNAGTIVATETHALTIDTGVNAVVNTGTLSATAILIHGTNHDLGCTQQ